MIKPKALYKSTITLRFVRERPVTSRPMQLHDALVGHVRRRRDLIGCSEIRTVGAQAVRAHRKTRFRTGVQFSPFRFGSRIKTKPLCAIHTACQTRQDGPVCVVSGRAGVNWTIALNVFELQIFRRRQPRVVGDPIRTRRSGRDTDKTVSSCLAWRCELGVTYSTRVRLR